MSRQKLFLFVVLCCCVPRYASALEPPRPTQAFQWETLPDLPDPVGLAGPYAGTSGGALLVAGGANFPGGRPWEGAAKVWHDDVFVLPWDDAQNSPGNQWRQLSGEFPAPLAYGVSLSVPDGVLCIGGGDAEKHSSRVFSLSWDGKKLTIAQFPELPLPCAFMCGARVGDVVYVAGGMQRPDARQALHTFWALDLSLGKDQRKWEELDPWPGPPRMLAVAGSQDGGFYLFSGAELVEAADGTTTRKFLTDAFVYRPQGGWRQIADLPRPAVAAPNPAIPLGQTHLAVVGGDDGKDFFRASELEDEHPGFPPEILGYHTVTDTWRPLGAFPKDPGPDPAGDPHEGTWPPVTTGTTEWHGRFVFPSGEARPGVRTRKVLWGKPITSRVSFKTADYFVLVLYLAALVGMGFYFSRRENTTEDFFLGGRRIPWWAAGMSIFGTQLSAITFMSIPALVYRTDWVYFNVNMMIVLIAPVVVYLYLPFYRRLDVTTAYEYLERRFNLATRFVGSLAFLLFQLGRMGVVLYLPALALATVTGFDIFVCIVFMGFLSTLYTVLGGIEAVVWTDVLQVLVLLGGAILCLFIIVGAVDGGAAEIYALAQSENKLRAVDFSWDFTTATLWVILLGQFLSQLVPYTADQTVIQRYLTTVDEKQAARSIWTNAVLTIPATILFFTLGTALWVFYKTHPELLNAAGSSDYILPWFVARQLPAGISGLVIAGLFAASMSSLDSSMNSMSTAITTDFYRRLNPTAKDHDSLKLARWLTVLLGVLGTGTGAYMAYMETTSMMDQYLKIVGLFGGGLAGLLVMGIFTRRANGPGALIGFLASAGVLFVIQAYTEIHFFLYATAGIFSCVLIGWLASLIFPSAAKDIDGLTLYTLKDA